MTANFGQIWDRYAKQRQLSPLLLIISLLAVGCTSLDKGQVATIERAEEATIRRTEKSRAVRTKETPAAEPTSCLQGEAHPLAQGIADEFEIEYEQIVVWFCQGHTFDDILLALQTSSITNETPGDLLALLAEMTWDEIWNQLGVTSLEGSQ